MKCPKQFILYIYIYGVRNQRVGASHETPLLSLLIFPPNLGILTNRSYLGEGIGKKEGIRYKITARNNSFFHEKDLLMSVMKRIPSVL